jgi:hypothetical protein
MADLNTATLYILKNEDETLSGINFDPLALPDHHGLFVSVATHGL